MALTEELSAQIKSYLKEMNEKEMRIALHSLKQEGKRRKRKKKGAK